MTRSRRILTAVLSAAVGLSAVAFASPAREVAAEGTHSPNMSHIARVLYHPNPNAGQGGTDVEFVTLELDVAPDGSALDTPETREFAIAGAYANGLHIVDITNPEKPVKYTYDCATAQSDIQVFTRDDMPGRTLMTVTADDPYDGETKTSSKCYKQAWEGKGFATKFGSMILDITNPYAPQAIGFAPVVRGSHNQTVHPSGKYLYNSSSDVGAVRAPGIDIIDITDLANPKIVKVLDQDDRVSGLDSHDITFNADGTRAYSAAVTETLVLDTTDPADPKIIGNIIDPAVNIHHQSDPITMEDPLGNEHTFIVISDEIAGAAGNAFCPGGGLHVYDVTGPLEMAPVKVGFWEIPETRHTQGGVLRRCTSHVLRLYPEEQLMTIAWYSAGVRVVDISGLIGVSVGLQEELGNVGVGMKEVGYYYFDNSDTWSVKTNKFFKDDDGNVTHFYLYGNDQARGFDVYKFDATAPTAERAGNWMTPEEIQLRAMTQPRADLSTYRMSCLLGAGRDLAA